MPWAKSFKCKYCTSDETLIFPPMWRKGKPLVNEHTGEPHKCKRDKIFQAGETKPKKKVWKKSAYYHGRTGDYDFGCDAPKNPTPTIYLCGKCNTELTQKEYEYLEINGQEVRQKTFKKTGCNCVLIGLNWCDKFCTKCDAHPQIIYATSQA